MRNAPHLEKKLRFHPTEDMGYRTVKTGSIFYIPKEDADRMREGDIFRLKDLYNVKVLKKNENIEGEFAGDKLIKNLEKIQWVTEEYFELSIFIPGPLFIGEKYNPDSLKVIKGFVEKALENVKDGEIIQFERFGFVRIERKGEEIIGILAHK